MKKLNIFLLLIIMLLKSNNMHSQVVSKSKTIPLLECENEDLKSILDSIFVSEKKCKYYSDTLLLSITFIVHPEDRKKYSVEFETGTRKKSMFERGKDLGVIGYFMHSKHICLIYNYIPRELIVNTGRVTKFSYKIINPKKQKSKRLLLDSYEDDSFSQWVYHFYNNKFYLYKKYNCSN